MLGESTDLVAKPQSSAHTRFPNLQRRLAEFGETGIKIAAVALMKFGCLALQPGKEDQAPASESWVLLPPGSKDEESSRDGGGEGGERKKRPARKRPGSAERAEEWPVGTWGREIIRALRSHPNVIDLQESIAKQPEIVDEWHIGPASGWLFVTPMYQLRVHMPARLQKYSTSAAFAGEKVIEEFGVAASGSIFAAFAEVDDFPTETSIGQEYRELVLEQLQKETRLKPANIWPNPIRLDFYLVLTMSAEHPRGLRVYAKDYSVIIVTDVHKTIPELVTGLLQEISFYLVEYYSVKLREVDLKTKYFDISQDFNTLSRTMVDATSLKWWKLRSAGSILRTGRKTLGMLHTAIVEFERLLLLHQYYGGEFATQLERSSILSKARAHFDKDKESHLVVGWWDMCPDELLGHVSAIREESALGS